MTGVQTCALPICHLAEGRVRNARHRGDVHGRAQGIRADFHGLTSLSASAPESDLEQEGDHAEHQDHAHVLWVDENREQGGGGDEIAAGSRMGGVRSGRRGGGCPGGGGSCSDIHVIDEPQTFEHQALIDQLDDG